MSSTELIRLVIEMRQAQKEYFRTKSGSALENSKRLERAVDKAIAQWSDGQGKLFGGEQ